MTAAIQSPLRATTPPDGISIVSLQPSGGSEGVRVSILFAGAQPSGTYNEVVFTPVTGAAKSVPGTSVILDPSKGLRQIGGKVPTGLAVGPGTVHVRDTKTNEKSAPVPFEVVAAAADPLESMAREATRTIRLVGSANAKFIAGKTSVAPDLGVKVKAVNVVSATELLVTVEVNVDAPLGPKQLLITTPDHAIFVTGLIVAAAANRNPVANANGPYSAQTAQPIVFNSSGTSDPDGDALQLSWDFGDGSTGTGTAPAHSYAAPGSFVVTLTVADGRGGTASATSAVTITAPITLTALSVTPQALRFSEANATTALLVTGHFSDNSTRDLTGSATGTTYLSSAPQVATVSTEGNVTSSANGSASITIANSGITTEVPVAVEIGVTMEALELTPPLVTIRELASTAQVTLRGRFSDGSLRDLTADAGTTYSLDTAIATVSAGGLLEATAAGDGVLTARNGGLTATSQVRVIVTDGAGFLRGEVYDDGRSLPLAGARVTPLVAGGVPVPSPQPVDADDRGRFTVGAAAGAALVRVEKDGYTSVERRSTLANGAIETLLDARLTRIDTRVNQLQSVFGGEAASADNTVAITIPAGSLDQDAALRVTPISAQGLQGLVPAGWSPIAAVDLQPANRVFAQGATLRVPHVDLFGAGAQVALARYDAGLHQWVVQAAGVVSSDRRTIAATIVAAGQYAFVVPDEAPLVPPAAQPGEVLAGVASVVVPGSSSATGSVLPRTAPPGEAARAVGTVILQPPGPLSSGAILRARVTEQFDLLDSSRITPQPFVQDVVLYARPRLGDAGTLAARLPITPSLQFTIQQLSLGTVRLDVTIAESSAANSIIGGTGGSVADANGDVLTLPAGAIGAEIAVGLLPLNESALSAAVPPGLTLLGAVLVDAPGATFAVPAGLSIARPAGVDDAAQVIVAQVITDTAGGRRFKIAGLGVISPTRIAIQTTLASLVFDGVRSGGEFVFLRSSQPLGFINGIVTSVSSPQSLALVTADTAPFAFLTSAAGTFIVAGRAGVPTVLTAVEPAGAAGTGNATLDAVNAIAAVNLALSHTSAIVTGTIPAANAVNVALDSSIVIDFSKPIDPATITAASVTMRAGTTAIAAARVVSANRRRLTVTPASPLVGLTIYAVSLTADVRDTAGNALTPFGPVTFTTLDPSKATEIALGVITADLPDDDGLSLVSGRTGAAEPNSVVAVTNTRTQFSVTVRTNADGSFRMRVPVVAGDELLLTMRDAAGRDTTLTITQLTSAAGATAMGAAGGTFTGAGGRVGRILPRSLATAGVFAIDSGADAPALPPPFTTLDQFALRVEGASFKQLDSLTLVESQARFAPAMALSAPLASTASLTVPADFVVSASLRFTATVADASGTRRSTSGTTVVVAAGADGTATETAFGTEFPTVFLAAPRQAVPAQVVEVTATAPAARIDLDLPVTGDSTAGHAILIGRRVAVNGESKLSLVDTLARIDAGGIPRLRTAGRGLPGVTRSGEYGVASGPVAFVTGRVNGPEAIVIVEGQPFVFETQGANGAFVVPVLADAPFALRFVDAATGAVLGAATGQPQQTGTTFDIGRPLTSSAGSLTVSAQPNAQSAPDINSPLVLTFSEPIDRASISNATIVVTDQAGVRVFGRILVDDQERIVTFVPSRRWRLGTRYRYGVTTGVAGASGAQLARAFAGEFTTFAPSAIGGAPVGSVLDVDAAGAIAIAGTNADARAVDVASPRTPATVATVAQPGGTRAVSVLPSTTITDRNGQSVAGTFALVASGDANTGGRLEVLDVSNPTLPMRIGTAQLTAIPGQGPPANVPGVAGSPRDLVVTADRHAVIALSEAGVVSVNLGRAIPEAPQTPAQAVEARYPLSGTAAITGVALLPDRVVASGDGGLTSLDAATLERRGVTFTGAGLRAVDALPSVPMDVNGDGTIAPETEVFDLAVATGGADGTLQFFRVPESGDPVLLSVVRVGGDTTGVVIDAVERLAFVSNGARGLAIVDLDGPASVQPLDTDHNGLDDRILGIADTPGSSHDLSLALERGVAFVADGAAGLTVVQLMPARTRFLTLNRDPIAAIAGEEESILVSRRGLVSDDAISVSLNAVVPPAEDATLLIEELGEDARVLSFADGSTATPLISGLNQRSIAIDAPPGAGEREVRLRVQNQRGATLAAIDFVLAASAGSIDVATVFAAPSPIVLTPEEPIAQLSVGAGLTDGRTVNVTPASAGTTYLSSDRRVATITADGLISAVAGGAATITIANGRAETVIDVRVTLPVALTSLVSARPRVTLTSPGQQITLDLKARYSDGGVFDALSGFGTTFESANTGVATVDGRGVVTGIGEGLTLITARNGEVTRVFEVAVEFRTRADLTAIEIPEFTAAESADTGLELRATVVGTGSLEGLTVTFTIDGAVTAVTTADTTYSGVAATTLRSINAGVVNVRASVVNPTTSAVLTSSVRSVTIAPAPGDREPNSDLASASAMKLERVTSGGLSASDRRDVMRAATKAAGTVTVTLGLSPETIPSSVTLAILSSSGTELARVVPSSREIKLTQALPPGPVFVAVESDGRPVTYSMRSTFTQANLTIGSVTPTAGGPGTVVTIDGTGFSTDPTDTRVMFGGIAGRTISATSSRIEALVPARAVDGPIEVISFARRVAGQPFVVGNAGPAPTPRRTRIDPPVLRFDPVLDAELDITKLTVFVDPASTEADIAALAAAHGGSVIGSNPAINSYQLGFANNTSLAAIHAMRRALATDPRVRIVDLSVPLATQAQIDIRSRGFGEAPALAGVWDAIDAIRATPPFCCDRAAFADVKVAVLDSGFDPVSLDEFTFRQPGDVVDFFAVDSASGVFNRATRSDAAGHGTKVASVIAAVNNDPTISPPASLTGVLNGLFRYDEQPYVVSVYDVSAVQGTAVGPVSPQQLASLDDDLIADAIVHAANNDVHIVNLSAARAYRQAEFATARDAWRERLLPLQGRALFVASAGNTSVFTEHVLPVALSTELPFVMGVAAVGVGAEADSRAYFADPPTVGDPCDTALVGISGSNCGPEATLAAPGKKVDVALAQCSRVDAEADTCGRLGIFEFDGTSAAAPIVSGVAGIIQAIRGQGRDPIAADVIKELLVSTSIDITSQFNNTTTSVAGSMIRLDALEATLTALPPPVSMPVYIADQRRSTSGGPESSVIVGMELDPLNGQRRSGADDFTIPLAFSVSGTTFTGKTAHSLVISPSGDFLYVMVSSDSPVGDGVMVVNTMNNQPEAFIPLSGATFPPSPNQQATAVKIFGSYAPMVLSRDGRLLYLSVSNDIRIINTVSRKLVERLDDLPSEYSYQATRGPLATRPPPGALSTRLQDLAATVHTGAGGRLGTSIRSLALSPDGTLLYAAFQTGNGPGNQVGGVILVNVDLYRDTEPAITGLQSDLSHYMTAGIGSPLIMAAPGTAAGGDEPSSVVVSPDGKYLYLTHGGFNAFNTYTPNDLQPALYTEIIGGAGFGLAASTSFSGGAAGVANALGAAGNSFIFQSLRNDIAEIADSGLTILSAPGFTGVFDAVPSGASVPQRWLFPSTVVAGWNPEEGGAFVDQFRFHRVFMSRPFAMAIRPDGGRALMAMHQTGNFGVLDLDYQDRFETTATPNPAFATLPDDMFQAVIATTESIELSNHLAPDRDARPGLASPDERLWFPWHIEYAQSGRFAVATHQGTFNASVEGPGGGAISVISDAAIERSLALHSAETTLTQSGSGLVTRPWFSVAPVCARPVLDNPAAGCAEEPLQHYYEYQPAGGGPVRFERPRGVAIYPYVHVQEPAFGDMVQRNTTVKVRWRDVRITEFSIDVVSLDTFNAAGDPMSVGSNSFNLSAEQRERQFMSAPFASLFMPLSNALVNGRRFRIRLAASAGSDEVSTTSIDVRFEDYSTPVQPERLTVTPSILPLSMTTTTTGRLAASFRPQGAGNVPVEDVTASASYNALDCSEPTLQSAITAIAGHLGSAAGFGCASLSVLAGTVTATTPGIAVVQARRGDVLSNNSVVLAGFEIDSIALEPRTAGAFENDALFNRVATALGNGMNAPLVLTGSDNGFLDDDARLLLDDVTLRYTTGDTIKLNALMDAIRPLISRAFDAATNGAFAPIGATPTWRNAQALVELLEGPDTPSLSYHLTYSSSNGSVASPSYASFFQAKVESFSAGLAIVSGVLDLGGFGSKADGVFVWSLPALDSATLTPDTVVIQRSAPASPGPVVRLQARTGISNAVIPRPTGFATDAEALREILPRAFDRVGAVFNFDNSYGTDFRFSATGHGSMVNGQITFSDFAFTFSAPTDGAPAIVTTFAVDDPTVVTLGARDQFTQHLVHRNVTGFTPIRGTVQVQGFGQAVAEGLVIVCDCPGPVVVKRLISPTTAEPGATVSYRITAANPTASALSNVAVLDELRLDGLLISSTTVNFGSIAPDSSRTVPFDVTAPFSGGVLTNTVSAPGFTALQPPPVIVPGGGIIISEMVLNPQRDWNDSTGGNGVAFDATPGTGTIDSSDVWIELTGGITGNQSWNLCLTDATSASVCQVLGPPVTTSQTRLRTGWGALTLPIVAVDVIDNFGITRQHLDITAIESALGPTTGVNDESLTWSVHGSPTLILQQFLRRVATISQFLPF